MRLLSEVAELFLPRRCAGCGREGVSLCTGCLTLLAGVPRAMVPRYGHLPVLGVSEFDTRVSHIVTSFKDGGRGDVLEPLAVALARSIVGALDLIGHRGGRVRVVPAPSSERARRSRGGSHVALLARHAGVLHPELGIDVIDVLAAKRRRDQVGLGAGARSRNVAGTQFLRKGTGTGEEIRRLAGSAPVILVDDVATTGATLAESTRVLESVQIRPAVAAVIGLGRGGTRFVSSFTV